MERYGGGIVGSGFVGAGGIGEEKRERARGGGAGRVGFGGKWPRGGFWGAAQRDTGFSPMASFLSCTRYCFSLLLD